MESSRRENNILVQRLNISWKKHPCSVCNTSLLLCLPSDQLNSPFLTSLTLGWISNLSPLWRIHCIFSPCFPFFMGRTVKIDWKNNPGCKESFEEVFWDSSQEVFLLSSEWLSLVCGSVQMSLVRTWAGGCPAPCPWPMDQRLPGWSPPDLSLSLRGRGSWRLPASPSWTALTLTLVGVSVFGTHHLYKFTSGMRGANNDWSACVFHSFRMSLSGADRPAALAWPHLWWMIHPRSLRWGRKVSQELFLQSPPQLNHTLTAVDEF